MSAPVQRARGAGAAIGIAALTAAVAALGSRTGDFESRWYRQLRKPAWQPSGRTIGLVWTGLYALTATSGGLLAARRPGGGRGRLIAGLFGLQYALNAAFTPIFTRRRDLALATVDSGMLCATVAALSAVSWSVRRSASLLLLPYVAWTAFATFLSATLLRLNRR